MNNVVNQVSDKSAIGKNTRIGSFAFIHDDVVIGDNCVIGSFCNISEGVRIGNNVSVQTGCHITRNVIINNNVFVGPGVITMNDKYIDRDNPKKQLKSPTIDSGSKIGGGTCLLPGVKIGKDVFIGAGSVVTKDVNDGCVVWGNPARIKELAVTILLLIDKKSTNIENLLISLIPQTSKFDEILIINNQANQKNLEIINKYNLNYISTNGDENKMNQEELLNIYKTKAKHLHVIPVYSETTPNVGFIATYKNPF